MTSAMDKTFTPQVVIDRASDEPLYQQIARPIEEAILSGQLPAGALIEDEVSMAQRLRVARPTARRAMQELVNRGLLSRRRGVGTRVTPPHVHRPMKLSSLNEDLTAAGIKPTTRVLNYNVREASPEEAESLGVEPGHGILSLERLRLADGHPLALMTNLIPIDIAPSWTDLGERGLYQCLGEKGARVVSARQVIGARGATAAEGKLLDEDEGAPLLTMERIGTDTDGRVIEVGRHVYRPSLYSFQLTLFAN